MFNTNAKRMTKKSAFAATTRLSNYAQWTPIGPCFRRKGSLTKTELEPSDLPRANYIILFHITAYRLPKCWMLFTFRLSVTRWPFRHNSLKTVSTNTRTKKYITINYWRARADSPLLHESGQSGGGENDKRVCPVVVCTPRQTNTRPALKWYYCGPRYRVRTRRSAIECKCEVVCARI